jgi:hypothetical protein
LNVLIMLMLFILFERKCLWCYNCKISCLMKSGLRTSSILSLLPTTKFPPCPPFNHCHNFASPQSLSEWLKPRLPSDSFSTWGVKPGTKNFSIPINRVLYIVTLQIQLKLLHSEHRNVRSLSHWTDKYIVCVPYF